MAFIQAIAAGVFGPIFVNETGQRQAIAGDVFVNETGFVSGAPRILKRRRKHAAPLKQRAYGNVAASITPVAPHTIGTQVRVQKARKKKRRPLRLKAAGNVAALTALTHIGPRPKKARSVLHRPLRLGPFGNVASIQPPAPHSIGTQGRVQKRRRRRPRPLRPFMLAVTPTPTPGEEFRAKGWIEPRHRPNNPDGPNARSRRKQAEQELADAISRLARQEPKPAPAAFRVKGIPSGSEVFVPGLEIALPPPKPAKAKPKRARARATPEPRPVVQAPPRVEVSVLMLHPLGIESLAAVGRPVIHDHERDAMDALLAIERLLAQRR